MQIKYILNSLWKCRETDCSTLYEIISLKTHRGDSLLRKERLNMVLRGTTEYGNTGTAGHQFTVTSVYCVRSVNLKQQCLGAVPQFSSTV